MNKKMKIAIIVIALVGVVSAGMVLGGGLIFNNVQTDTDSLVIEKDNNTSNNGNNTLGGNSVQIPNPFVECENMKKAEELTGFSLTPPAQFPNWLDKTVIRASKDNMIEMIFTGGENKVVLRKAAGSDDISGDYTTYNEENKVNVNDIEVTMKGNDGKVNLAIWTKDNYTFAMRCTPGMDSESLSKMIGTIK